MIAIAGSLVTILVILIFTELLFNAKQLKGEFGRKFIHITVGTFVAFWPFYMSFTSIKLIAAAFLLVVLASRWLSIFKAIRSVNRQTWGDILFAVGIGLTAFMTKSNWVFFTAILNLSLADGLAAVMGKRFGQKTNYKVLGYTKSLVGTVTFLLVSLTILLFAIAKGASGVALWPIVLWLPLASTALENLGILGLDNVFVPLLIVLALSGLKFAS